MLRINGGCEKCHRVVEVDFKLPYFNNKTDVVICEECYHTYYEPQIIRDKKINKILKKPWYKIWQ